MLGREALRMPSSQEQPKKKKTWTCSFGWHMRSLFNLQTNSMCTSSPSKLGFCGISATATGGEWGRSVGSAGRGMGHGCVRRPYHCEGKVRAPQGVMNLMSMRQVGRLVCTKIQWLGADLVATGCLTFGSHEGPYGTVLDHQIDIEPACRVQHEASVP